VADSVRADTRGLAFGFHRAMDTAGAMIGLIIAAIAVWLGQKANLDLTKSTFQTIVLISLVPAFLAVLSLAIGAQDVKAKEQRALPKFSFKNLGKPFMIYLIIVGIFTLGTARMHFWCCARRTWVFRFWVS
jgi:divalent metal cation (Fe/Co/Zn/Cd) transporter